MFYHQKCLHFATKSFIKVNFSDINAFFLAKPLHFFEKYVSLHRVFHSIRFKVNKVGIQWYPIFFALYARVFKIHNIFMYGFDKKLIS